jgi:hypothetical protein
VQCYAPRVREMPITLTMPQGGRELKDRLLYQLDIARRQLAYDVEWSVLVWKAQEEQGWNIFVRGSSGVASESLDDLDDELLVSKLLRLLLRTSQVTPASRRAG